MALLTSRDVKKYTFQTVRFRESCGVDEVGDFLDWVTETVEALGRQAVADGQATQTLGPDVTNLNTKIFGLTGRVRQLESGNVGPKNTMAQAQQAAQAGNDRAAQLISAKLSEVEESNHALPFQNEQLRGQADQLNAQIDQLTAQAARASDGQKAVGQQIAATQQEHGQFHAANEELSCQLAATQQQGSAAQQQSAQIAGLPRQLEEAKQRESQLRAQVSEAELSTEAGSLQKIAGAVSVSGTEPECTTTMLTLTMQLHGQYVKKSKDKAKEATEASQNKYNGLVTKANNYSERTRSEADDYSTRTRSDTDTYSDRARSEADAYRGQIRADAGTYSQNTRSETDAYSVKTRQNANNYSKSQRDDIDNYEEEVWQRAAEHDKNIRSVADAYNKNIRSATDTYAEQVRDNLQAQSKVIKSNIRSLKQFETEHRVRFIEHFSQPASQASGSNNYVDWTSSKTD